jgi:hypothetical protein
MNIKSNRLHQRLVISDDQAVQRQDCIFTHSIPSNDPMAGSF